MKKVQIPVALEGYPFIALAALATLVAALLQYHFLAVVGLALTTFILFFFRDPDRVLPDAENAMVSPADGKVIVIDRLHDDKYGPDGVYKVSIFMNVFDVHVNRMPFAGRVEGIGYAPGKFYSADSQRGALENEACALTVVTARDVRFTVVQVAGLIARRIVCWAEKGDTLARGERFGLIRFGSRVDLYLPMTMKLEVSMGQRVRAGETVIGYLS